MKHPSEPILTLQPGHRIQAICPALDDQQWYLFCEWTAAAINRSQDCNGSGFESIEPSEKLKTWKFRTPNDAIVAKFSWNLDQKIHRVEFIGISTTSVNELVGYAEYAAKLRPLPPSLWYASMQSVPFQINAPSAALQMRRGFDRTRTVAGRAALNGAYLEFSQVGGDPKGVAMFSEFSVTAYFGVQGVLDGPHSRREAATSISHIKANLAMCLGRPILLTHLRPIRGDDLPILDTWEKRRDYRTQLRLRDVFVGMRISEMHLLGASEAAHRVMRAMVSFEAALEQQSTAATILHLVCAIEALARPNCKSVWKLRPSARFIDFLELCAHDELELTLKHPEFYRVFPETKSPRKLAERIYNARSASVHSGYFGEYHDPINFGGEAGILINFVTDIVEAAVVHFLKNPFSSMIGHPARDRTVQIQVRTEVLCKLSEAAESRGIHLDDLLHELAATSN